MTTIAAAPKLSRPLVPQADLDKIIQLDETARAANTALVEASIAGNEMAKGLIMARAIRTLQSLLTGPVMADVMQLMNSPLGFKTDRAPGTKDRDGKNVAPYGEEVVRDVLVQALIRGVRPTGNELNIIAGQLYVTKEGYERLVSELPGLTDLRIEVGVPKLSGDKGALCDARASWKFNGQPQQLLCENGYAIPVRVNAAMGTDAIQGKATSKMLRRIYKIVTHMDLGPADVLDDAPETTIEQPVAAAADNRN